MKKTVLFSLISILLLSGLFVLSTAVSGDVNKDEAVNNKDVTILSVTCQTEA